MTDFSPCLWAIVSHDETVLETWEIPLGPLPSPSPPVSGDPLWGEAMDMSPGSPPEDNLTEIDPETEASLADFSVQSADATSIWIHAFAAAPRPFSSDLLHISGQAIHDMFAEAFKVDAESFWISCNSKPIPRAETSLAAISVLPGSSLQVLARGMGGSLVQLSLDYFLPSSHPLLHFPPPSPSAPSGFYAGTAHPSGPSPKLLADRSSRSSPYF